MIKRLIILFLFLALVLCSLIVVETRTVRSFPPQRKNSHIPSDLMLRWRQHVQQRQQQQKKSSIQDKYQPIADLIIETALKETNVTKLNYLCDRFGNRFAGSQHLRDATAWIIQTMKQENLTGETEDISMNQWFRGEESAYLMTPYKKKLNILGLGGTVASGGTITAPVLVVTDWDDLDAKADQVPGKIVVFNVPFTTYGDTVQYRSQGAVEVAKYGGLASVVRSVTPYSLYTPHTGMMSYEDDVPKIPAFAVTVEDAELMGRLQGYGEPMTIQFTLDSYHQDIVGQNILATIQGRSDPKKIVAFGGHIDSWDVGAGAIDDGGGYFSTWEAVRILNDLIGAGAIIPPRRSIRSIGWFNEENGSNGANYYYSQHSEIEDHILVGETDNGNFFPMDFGFSGGSEEGFEAFSEVVSLLSVWNITATQGTGSTTDNRMWCGDQTACSSLHTEGNTDDDPYYFYFHHTDADTPDKLDADGLAASVASLAVVLYVTADMPAEIRG